MSGDSAHLRADGEGDLHHLVQRGLIAGGAERALVVLFVHVSQGRGRVEHAAAAGTQDIPRQLENADARGVQERGDHSFFVQAALGREIEDVDAAKFVIGSVPDQCFHGGDRFRVGRLSHDAEQTLGARFAHGAKSFKIRSARAPWLRRREIAMEECAARRRTRSQSSPVIACASSVADTPQRSYMLATIMSQSRAGRFTAVTRSRL